MKSKNVIKINESQLKQIVSESIRKVLKEDMHFNDVDDGGVNHDYDMVSIIEYGEYDNEIRNMSVIDCDEWVDYINEYYGAQAGAAALKRATMVNKKYAMSNKRNNVDFGVMSYNDYRSPNFYNGPHSQANVVNKPTPVGMEDYDTKEKYGVQQYNRPEVGYNSSSYPEWDGERQKSRLEQYLDKSYMDKVPFAERDRGGE